MPDYYDDEIVHTSSLPEKERFAGEIVKSKTLLDYLSLGVATCGVGFIPLAPGTWGSAIGVLIYLFVRAYELEIVHRLSNIVLLYEITTAWLVALNSVALLIFCLLGIWASNHAARIFQKKDPQKVVVDEVMGQLIVFLFVPFGISWKLVLAGFVLFRLFDIWKPYPINSLENLPGGIGVCADDIMAGVYGGICLAFLYAVQISV